MSTQTLTPDTPLDAILTSLRARSVLKDQGFTTLGDLRGANLERIAGTKGVGDVTMEELSRALGALAEPEADEAPVTRTIFHDPDPDDVEEGPQPIRLSSPYANYATRLTDASHYMVGRRTVIIKPLFIQFDGGEGQLTQEMWLRRKYPEDAAARARARNEPWRREAVAWLRNKTAFKHGEFIILSD